jgi:chromosome segregation ATPase
MQSMKRLGSTLLVAGLLCGAQARAEDPVHGRLPDGRAYRTDDQGNQLVDYIAELELNIEALNRQVQGLQGELDQKNAQLKSHGGGSSRVVERDITASSSRPAAVRETAAPDCGLEIKACQANLVQARTDTSKLQIKYDEDAITYRNTIQRLEGDLQSLQRAAINARALNSDRSANLTELNVSMNKLEEERDRLLERTESQETELVSLRTRLADIQKEGDARIEKARLEMENSGEDMSEQFKRCRSALDDAQEKVSDLERELGKKNEQLDELRASHDGYEARPVKSDTASDESAPRAGFRKVPVEPALEDEDADLGAARTRAVQILKGRLNSEINMVNALISSRDRLYREYRRVPGASQVSPSRLVSSRQESLGLIMSKTRAASNVRDLSQLARGVDEIRATVEDDIARIKKVSKYQ